VAGIDYLKRLLFEPTCTICGMESGYTGSGLKTVSPGRAKAKLDFRLVPDQRPDDILAKLRNHLDSGGFSDVRVTPLGGLVEPARTPLSSPFVRLVADEAGQIYGTEPVVMPTMAATGPVYCFVNILEMPVASAGVSYPDSRVHAPDENIRLEDLRLGMRHQATIVERLSRGLS
jgi:acetylornithine deacetylase/succinyl-diaminopimelate desuccinylase-like protein